MSPRLQLLSISILFWAAIMPQGILAQPSELPAAGSATQEFVETEVRFASGDLTLAGTLFMPRSAGVHPAVLFVHGDRPGERDGYRPYAEHFARNGIAALIYDRRGSGKSEGEWLGTSFEDFAADALAGVRFLRDRKQIDKAWVGLWGISQGVWVTAIAAATSADVAFLIAVSGAGMSPAAQATWLYRNTLHSRGAPSGLVSQGQRALRLFFDALDVLRRSGPESVRSKLPGLNLYHDPVPILERVRQPVLAIYGARDASVPPRTSAEILQAALRRSRNTAVTLLIFPEADHTLTVGGEAGNHAAPGFLDAMTAWVHGLIRGDTAFTAPVATLRPGDLPPEIVDVGHLGWFGSFPVQLTLFVLFGLVFLSPLCAWPLGFLVQRLRGRPGTAGSRVVRGGAALVSALNLLLLAGLARLLGGHVAFIVNAQFVQQRGSWQAMVALALLSTVLTCGLALATRRMLVSGEGSRSGRLHSAIVVGVALLFVPFLGYWHLLWL
jgi:hypothetical protein